MHRAILWLTMTRSARAPHADSLEVAVPHFNEVFRHRYRLPPATIKWLQAVPGLDEHLADLPTVRADGVADASCALIARIALSRVPRYAIGFVDGSGRIHVDAPAGAMRPHIGAIAFSW
jgi:hypothetical protein